MVINSSCEGLIFLFRDKCVTNAEYNKHNYLIIGYNSNNRMSFAQCMSITSMSHKEINMEVPILLSNGMISYVVPYNIHSFQNNDIDLKNYKGCLSDNEFISKKDFIQLLVDIYADSLAPNQQNHDEVVERYKVYCNNFWKLHNDCAEFRTYKDEKNSKLTDTPTEADAPVISNTNEHYEYKNKFKKKLARNSRNKSKRKENKRARKEYNNMIKELTGIRSVEEIKYEDDETIRDLIPLYTDYNKKREVILDDLKSLNDAPRNCKEFQDDQLILFIKGYNKFSYKELKSVIPHRWNAPSSFKNFYYSAKKEANQRKLRISYGAGMYPNDKMNTSCTEWSTDELRHYVEIVDNHKKDKDFLIKFTGYDNINEVKERYYKVKKELTERM